MSYCNGNDNGLGRFDNATTRPRFDRDRAIAKFKQELSKGGPREHIKVRSQEGGEEPEGVHDFSDIDNDG